MGGERARGGGGGGGGGGGIRKGKGEDDFDWYAEKERLTKQFEEWKDWDERVLVSGHESDPYGSVRTTVPVSGKGDGVAGGFNIEWTQWCCALSLSTAPFTTCPHLTPLTISPRFSSKRLGSLTRQFDAGHDWVQNQWGTGAILGREERKGKSVFLLVLILVLVLLILLLMVCVIVSYSPSMSPLSLFSCSILPHLSRGRGKREAKGVRRVPR